MSDIIENPRTFSLAGEQFTDAHITYLKNLFPLMDMVKKSKRTIRKDQIVQKAILAGVIICNHVQTEDDLVMLSLSQSGRDLLGKV